MLNRTADTDRQNTVMSESNCLLLRIRSHNNRWQVGLFLGPVALLPPSIMNTLSTCSCQHLLADSQLKDSSPSPPPLFLAALPPDPFCICSSSLFCLSFPSRPPPCHRFQFSCSPHPSSEPWPLLSFLFLSSSSYFPPAFSFPLLLVFFLFSFTAFSSLSHVLLCCGSARILEEAFSHHQNNRNQSAGDVYCSSACLLRCEE